MIGDIRSILVANGRLACKRPRPDSGNTIDHTVEDLVTHDFESEEALAIEDSAVINFCPKYMKKMVKWINDNDD